MSVGSMDSIESDWLIYIVILKCSNIEMSVGSIDFIESDWLSKYVKIM